MLVGGNERCGPSRMRIVHVLTSMRIRAASVSREGSE